MSEAQLLVGVRPFPQLQRRQKLQPNKLHVAYSRATNNEVAFRWINRDFINGLKVRQAPKLSEAGARVARDLKANGIALAELHEFFDPSFLEVIRKAFDVYREEFDQAQAKQKKPPKGKTVFLDVIHKSHTFIANDPVSSYLAEPMFAAIAAEYMKMVPRYVGSSFWHTKPAPGDRLYSQSWHRDYNDRRLVKWFLYLNDVGRENGYFEQVTGTHIHGPYGRVMDRIGPEGYRAYPDSQAVDEMVAGMPVVNLDSVPKSNWFGSDAPWHNKPSVLRCQGKAGTMLFADTFGIHRGGFIQQGHRDMIMGTYSTNFNIHKPHFEVTSEFAETLSPFMKMAFGLAESNKPAA